MARLVESLGQIGGPPARTLKSVPIARARTCYDHLAGQLGVAVFAALVARGAVKARKNAPGDVELGSQAEPSFRKIGSSWRSCEGNAAALPPRVSTGPSAVPTWAALSVRRYGVS